MNNHLFQLLGVETWQQSNFQFFDLWYFGWSERFCPNKWVVILTSVHRSTEVPTRSSSGTSRCQLSLNALVMADLLGWNNWPNHPLEKENNKMQVSSYVEYTALELKTILNYTSPSKVQVSTATKTWLKCTKKHGFSSAAAPAAAGLSAIYQKCPSEVSAFCSYAIWRRCSEFSKTEFF